MEDMSVRVDEFVKRKMTAQRGSSVGVDLVGACVKALL
jgi:hypothetical protein